jgi:hypothetical protein
MLPTRAAISMEIGSRRAAEYPCPVTRVRKRMLPPQRSHRSPGDGRDLDRPQNPLAIGGREAGGRLGVERGQAGPQRGRIASPFLLERPA